MNRLDRVRTQRLAFERLNRRIIAGTLEYYLPAEGPVVEIGMGDGQLCELLPDAMRPRLIHTEPDAAVSREFRKQHPGAIVVQAPAERLPFDAGSAAAVIGLCVLDVVPDGPRVARELARILRPGGRLIHWLDMSTVLESVVGSLWKIGMVPFPNWSSDPSAAEWPEDLLLVPREQLTLVVEVLRRAEMPLAHPLEQYLAHFSSAPVTAGAAAAELVQLQESSMLRNVLSGAFRLAFDLAGPEHRARLAEFQSRPLSSARHFENRLRSWFTEQAGFRIDFSGLNRAWETTRLEDPAIVYRSCLAGEQRHLSYLPDPAALLCSDAASDPGRETLIELGVFTFVATRL